MSGLISAGADLITVLTDICTGLGALCLLLWTLAILGACLAVRAERKAAEVPEAGDWVDSLIADLGKCPWCETRECLDSTRCTCDDPCGMRYCKALDSEVTP